MYPVASPPRPALLGLQRVGVLVFVLSVELLRGASLARSYEAEPDRHISPKLLPDCPGAKGCESSSKVEEEHAAETSAEKDSTPSAFLESLLDAAKRRWQESGFAGRESLSFLGVQRLVPKSPPPYIGPAPHAGVSAVNAQKAKIVQHEVLLACLAIVVTVYMLGFVVLIKDKYHPPEGRERAKFSEEDEEDEEEVASTWTSDGAEDATPQPPPQFPSNASMDSMIDKTLSKQKSRLTSHYLRSGHVKVSTDDLISDVGISAMCIFEPDSLSGVTKVAFRFAVPLIAVQSMLLQLGLLHFLKTQLIPSQSVQHTSMPHSIIFISIYLHFLNCVGELPYSLQLFRHLPDFHDKLSDLFLMGSVLISDAFVIPLLSLIIGGLYLCTSRTVADAILNAVAVAFIHEIDNWILGLNTRTNFLAGKVKSRILHLPLARERMRFISWTCIYVPVVPVIVSGGLCWIGFHYFEL